jgi:PAS domain S-box-containing protein
MEWQWSIWVIVELSACMGLVALTFYSRRIITTPFRNLSTALFTLGATFMLLNAMEIGAVAPSAKYICFELQFIILSALATVWLAVILKYVREDRRFAPRAIALLCILPVVVAVLVLTNEAHHLFWTGSSPSNNAFLFFYRNGPLFWVSMTIMWAYFLYGVYVLIRQLRFMAQPLRGDAFTIMFAAVVVMIMGVFDISNVERFTPYPLSPIAFGFTIAFVLIVIGFRFLRTTYIRPMAEEAALDSLNDAFIAIDTQARVFYMNTAGERLTGLSLANAYQRPLKELLHSWPQQILDMVQQTALLANQIGIEDNGKQSWYEIGLSPISDPMGNLMGKVLLIRDITDRIRDEKERHDIETKAQLASRLSTVGQMAAGICHEINNPLTTVIGYSDLLTAKDLPADVKQEVGYIREAGRRVADIVKQLLAFARNAKPVRTVVDINDIVSRTLRLHEYQLRMNNIKILTELAKDLPYTIADAGQLQQVFLNIVLNAEAEMKSAHNQGVLLVKTECVGDTIRVSFKDDGPGIPEENINRIFDPFFTTRKIGEGTGLGLSVCHGIVTELNGRIYAESEQGKGATFIVELPRMIASQLIEIPSTANQEIRQVGTRQGGILVIDDEMLLLEFLEQFLTAKGHDVDAVTNASDALRLFKSKMYDLILMDILMPDVSGIELYKKFRRIDKSIGDRVLIMTGDILGKPTRAFLSRTKIAYIEKPFDDEELVTKINEIMIRNQEQKFCKSSRN